MIVVSKEVVAKIKLHLMSESFSILIVSPINCNEDSTDQVAGVKMRLVFREQFVQILFELLLDMILSRYDLSVSFQFDFVHVEDRLNC